MNEVVYGQPVRSEKAEANASRIHQRIESLILSLNPLSVLEIGSGRGSLGGRLSSRGIRYAGIEPMASEINAAKALYPDLEFRQASVYDDPATLGLGKFDVVVSNDVVEHLYDPRVLVTMSKAHLNPGGRIVCGTPDYGNYWRNLMIGVTNGWDRHHTVHWDGGHIKFFSKETLGKLWSQDGFHNFQWGHLSYPYVPFANWYLHCVATLK